MESSHFLQCLHLPLCDTGRRLARSRRKVERSFFGYSQDTIEVWAQISGKSKVWTILNPESCKNFAHERVKSGLQSQNSQFTPFTQSLATHGYLSLCVCSPNSTTCSSHPPGRGSLALCCGWGGWQLPCSHALDLDLGLTNQLVPTQGWQSTGWGLDTGFLWAGIGHQNLE